MAKHDAKWTPDVEDGPATAPETRDNLVQENRARRQAEPAAAPQETDSESGTPAAVPLTPRAEPVRSHAVYAAETGQHDVRVGPGDAGASDSPKHSTEPAPGRSDSWRRVIAIVAVVFIVGVVASIVMAA